MSTAQAMTGSSKVAGYERALHRDHGPRLQDGADMEPAALATYAQQDKVPRLPVPPLEHTLELLVRSAAPHVSPEELAELERKAAEFARPGGIGEKLQARLLARKEALPNSSWLCEWWNDLAYLSYRDSVVYNVSYYLQFEDELPAAMRPTRRAARFVSHALAFREQLVSGTLAPDMSKGTPMSMSQFKFMFNACRIPGAKADVVRTFAPDVFNHVVVVRKNRFFALDLLLDGGKALLSVDQLQAQLDRVVRIADGLGRDPYPVGVLSADDRDVWYRNRQLLLTELTPEMNAANAAALRVIESAVLVICLDDGHPTTREEVGRALLHGDGQNRFWDKALQVVFFDNGRGGFVGEHAMMDGLTTTRMVNFALDKMFADSEALAAGAAPPATASLLPEPRPVTFALDAAARDIVLKSASNFAALMATKEMSVLMFHGYGKKQIKGFRMSPDAFAQLALQYAYFKTFGTVRGTYESTQTRSFLHGRTEVTRSVTLESTAFCRAMASGAPMAECYQKMVAATQAHSSYSSKASKGMGCDRHLLGLKLLLQEGESAELFSDIGVQRSGTWALSTSGLVGEHMDGWGFGEVVPHGIGVGYSVLNDRLRFTVTSRHQWAPRITANLEAALLEMRKLAETCGQDAAKSKL